MKKHQILALLTLSVVGVLLLWALGSTPQASRKEGQQKTALRTTSKSSAATLTQSLAPLQAQATPPQAPTGSSSSPLLPANGATRPQPKQTPSEVGHSCESCSNFPAQHPQENRELTPVEKYSLKHNTFPPGITTQQLPEGEFKTQLMALPLTTQEKVVQKLVEDQVPVINLNSLKVEKEGGLFFVCNPPAPVSPENLQDNAVSSLTPAEEEIHTEVASSAVPISDPPARSSKPGSINTLYIDFNGHLVSGTAWGSTAWNCMPLDTDGDPTSFSPEEQSIILRVWEHVAEDYAPFDFNVTTVEPATFNRRTARALVTRNTDRNGVNLPYHTSGGVAFINVFNTSNYVTRNSPAFVYYNLQSNVASHIADAVSHEIGHNLGLYHDGLLAQGGLPASEYYYGHGSDATSWGPIMGSPFWKNVSQWSKGEYHRGNNLEDDLAKISGKLAYRGDDHPSSLALANQYSGPTSGIIEQTSDSDTWWIETHSSLIVSLQTVNLGSGGGRGGNLHGVIDIFNESGKLVSSLTSNSSPDVTGTVPLTSGKYYIQVRSTNVGAPLSSPPSGYTHYGSLGQYSLTLQPDQPPVGFDVYEQWALSNLNNPNKRSPYDQTESNGITNLEKFAYGIPEGLENANALLPTVTTVEGITAIRFRIAHADVVTYRVLQSQDMSTWTEIDISAHTSNEVTNSDGTTSVTVRASTSALPVFLRVSLNLPEN